MTTRLGIIVFLCSIVTPSYTQSNMFEEALTEFATSKLWEYEEIPVKWDMEGSLQADLNDGVNSLFEDEPEVAEASFTKVLEKNPKIWQAYYYRAACLKKQKKLYRALKDMRQALKFNGDFYEGYIELGKIHALRNEIVESDEAIDKALRLNKTRGIGYYIRGDIALTQGHRAKALNNYKTCLEVDSLFHDARIKLALVTLTKKDEASALPHLNRVLQYDSLQKSALLFRAIILSTSDKEQSIQELT